MQVTCTFSLHPQEVKLPEPSSGTLRLPEDLDEVPKQCDLRLSPALPLDFQAEALDMMLTGKALTDQARLGSQKPTTAGAVEVVHLTT